MSTTLETRNRTPRARGNDPFALMRSLFGFDPFYAVEDRMAKASFAPSFEVKETENAYVIAADLPGVKEEDLDISLHNNVLSISGHRKAEERKEGETYFIYERQYGSFSRAFSLPDEADGGQVQAAMANGVLTVRVGKKAESKPRRIQLNK